MYLLYEEYQDMGGTLDEATFTDLEFGARSQIDWYTFNRLQDEETLTEAVKRCTYKLIQLIEEKRNASALSGSEDESSISAGVASQSNDGVSISYNVLSAGEAVEMLKNEIADTIKHYLQGVKNSLGQKVLYRGLYPGE